MDKYNADLLPAINAYLPKVPYPATEAVYADWRYFFDKAETLINNWEPSEDQAYVLKGGDVMVNIDLLTARVFGAILPSPVMGFGEVQPINKSLAEKLAARIGTLGEGDDAVPCTVSPIKPALMELCANIRSSLEEARKEEQARAASDSEGGNAD